MKQNLLLIIAFLLVVAYCAAVVFAPEFVLPASATGTL